MGWAVGNVGPIVVLGPAEGSDFLSVGEFGQSEEYCPLCPQGQQVTRTAEESRRCGVLPREL